MGNKKLIGLLVLSFCLICTVACEDDDEGDGAEKVVITVAAEVSEKSYTPSYLGKEILREYMKVREVGETEWKEFDFNQIIGFRYEDGYEYQLELEKILSDPSSTLPSITYKLSEVLSKTPKSESLLDIRRFCLGEPLAVVRGKDLKEEEKEVIRKRILDDVSWNGWLMYKFIYTDTENFGGPVIVYDGNIKKEGTFKMSNDQKLYDLKVDGVVLEYDITTLFTRTSARPQLVFVRAVTDKYKPDYPALEEAYVEYPIGWAQ